MTSEKQHASSKKSFLIDDLLKVEEAKEAKEAAPARNELVKKRRLSSDNEDDNSHNDSSSVFRKHQKICPDQLDPFSEESNLNNSLSFHEYSSQHIEANYLRAAQENASLLSRSDSPQSRSYSSRLYSDTEHSVGDLADTGCDYQDLNNDSYGENKSGESRDG